MSRYPIAALFVLAATSVLAIGCSESANRPQTEAPMAESQPDGVAAERAKLSPEDRSLVEAQEWCVVQTDERLGSMSPPIKLDIKGQPVFVCCKGCKRKAESNPDKTLAKVEELKAKARAEKDQKK